MALSLSTSWNASRHTVADELVFEITGLGFREIELSFSLPVAIVEGIGRLVDAAKVNVTSVHNFCPLPEGLVRSEALPDYYAMSSPDEQERQSAVKLAYTTIDTACRMNARAVVLHCGRVQIPDRTGELIKLYDQGKRDSKEFAGLRGEVLAERSSLQKKYLESTLKSLDQINAYAALKKIRLGIETRYYYREIPDFTEIGIILEAFRGSQLFYWHDVGHAQVMENLGFARHKDYLDAYRKYLGGIHIHDVKGCSDHQAPGKGEFDFRILKDYLDSDTIKVMEAHHMASAQDISDARKMLERLL